MTWDQPPRSRTGRQIAKAAQAAGWRVTVTPGQGLLPVLDPDRPTTGQGARPNVYIDQPIQSEGIRLQYGDQRAVALLISHDNGKTWTGHENWIWTADTFPTQIPTRQLLAHLTPERTTP